MIKPVSPIAVLVVLFEKPYNTYRGTKMVEYFLLTETERAHRNALFYKKFR